MPELPEVETIVQGLKEQLIFKKIIRVRVKEPMLIAYPSVEEFKQRLENKKIISLGRRGKYILIFLEKAKTLVIHLRMTGRLLVEPRNQAYNKHTHVILELDNNCDLRFDNVRKFGRLYLVKKGEWDKAGGLANLGIEPLTPMFSLLAFKKLLKNRKSQLKSLLLNQSFIAGLGNIYADEALFQAGISPKRKANSLSQYEIEKLHQAIEDVLKKGIKYGGTSMRDYVNAWGKKGNFQNRLKVYQLDGNQCPRCQKGKIFKEKIVGRSSHYCPYCQK